MNIIIAGKEFSANHIYLFFSAIVRILVYFKAGSITKTNIVPSSPPVTIGMVTK